MNQTENTSISAYLTELRTEIESALDQATVFDSDCPVRLSEAIRYSVLAPGKRLRPLLTLLACELCGGSAQNAMPAACAVEMIHAYSLIHDDLPSMDNDDLRRGRPTCHIQFDEPTAILAGDAIIPLAFEMIARLQPLELAGRCCMELAIASGPRRLVGGQMDDVSREKGLGNWKETHQASRELMEKIHVRKTGALMRVALTMGGLIANASAEQLEALDRFGIHYGLAFQITDDLLDVTGDEKLVGKRLHKDADKDKWSYPTLLGIDQSRTEAEKTVQQANADLDRIAATIDSPQTNRALSTLRQLVGELLDRKM